MIERFDSLQRKTEIWRERFFKPILQRSSFHPHDISTFRLFLALGFPLLIIAYPVLAWISISVSIILDGFDGVVARYEKIASDRGKFIDVLVDQITFVLLCLGLMRLLPDLSIVLATIGFIIPLSYLMTMVQKNEKEPSDWLIKPQARLTGYKIVFLIIIIGYLCHWFNKETMYLLLWLEAITAALHFSLHYHEFINNHKN